VTSATPVPTTDPAPATGTATPGRPADNAAGLAEFVAVVQDQLPQLAAERTDDEIAAVAVTACAGLAAGLPADTIVAQAQSLGTLDAEATDPATAGELVKLAIDRVCLDQATRVDEF
jgi:hypothetical protein